MLTHTLFCFNVLVRFDVKIWSLKCIVSVLQTSKTQVGNNYKAFMSGQITLSPLWLP